MLTGIPVDKKKKSAKRERDEQLAAARAAKKAKKTTQSGNDEPSSPVNSRLFSGYLLLPKFILLTSDF
jgi:hypothetical protein